MNNRKVILYSIPSLSGSGGMEKVICLKANYFSEKLDYEVFILLEDLGTKSIAFPLSEKVNIVDMNISTIISNNIKGLSFILNIFKLRKLYERKINEIQPDIIIATELGYSDFVIPYIYKNIPKVREYHFSKKASDIIIKKSPFSVRFQSKIMKMLYYSQFKKYDALVVLTESDKKSWIEKINNIFVIPNFIESSDFYQKSLIQRPKKIISVGSMHTDRKGFDDLIDMWGEIKEKAKVKGWTLHIYGDGTLKEKYKQQINELGLQNDIFLEGIIKNIEKKYQESQLFLFASKAEGLPMVILEAQSNGLPVVSYDCDSGPSDILRDNKGGYLIELNDKTTFIDTVSLLLDNNILREQKSNEALINAERFNASNVMPLWVELFQILMK